MPSFVAHNDHINMVRSFNTGNTNRLLHSILSQFHPFSSSQSISIKSILMFLCFLLVYVSGRFQRRFPCKIVYVLLVSSYSNLIPSYRGVLNVCCSNQPQLAADNNNSVALVRERTIPTERPPLVGEVTANFCG
jgi:hypothetical protein